MKFFKILFVLLINANYIFASGETPPVSNFNEFSINELNEIDSMVVVLYNNQIVNSYESYSSDFILLEPDYIENEKNKNIDSIYESRLNLMASAINLPYNKIVRRHIDTYLKKERLSNILGLSMYYMPIFEKELVRQGLPVELKILPIIESALRPNAISPAGASGLWQFMYPTGKQYGLRVNSFIDERFDPVASTKAACSYLKALYNIYEDWTLVLAAYNCGLGNVNKALKRAKNADNYWDIYYYLPAETRGYVPAFIGATYAYAFHKNYNIEAKMPKHTIVVDTVQISNKMLHFEQISSTIDVSLKELRLLNPIYKLDIVPAVNCRLSLTLPVNAMMEFVEKEEEIYAKSKRYLKGYSNTENVKGLKDGFILHRVKRGEVLGSISRKYKVKTANIMKWNNISNASKIREGQRLRIFL